MSKAVELSQLGEMLSVDGATINIDDTKSVKMSTQVGHGFNSGSEEGCIRVGSISGIGARAKIKLLGSNGYGDPKYHEMIADVATGNASGEFSVNVYSLGNSPGAFIGEINGVQNAPIFYADEVVSGTTWDIWIHFWSFSRYDIHVEPTSGWTSHFDNRSTSSAAGIPATATTASNYSTYAIQADKILFEDKGSNEVARFSDLKMGIGTESPQSLLHLQSDGDTVLTIESDISNTDESNGPEIRFLTDGGLRTAAITGGNATYEALPANANALNLQSQTIRFHTGATQDFELTTERMIVRPDGKVGINTPAPNHRFEVTHDGATSFMALNTATDTPINRNIGFTTNRSLRWNIYVDGTAEQGSDSGSNFKIAAYGDNGVYREIPFFIQRSTGYVGIGNSVVEPDALLHVSSKVSGDALMILESDTDNNNENDNTRFYMYQDGRHTTAMMALESSGGSLATDTRDNALVFEQKSSGIQPIQFAVGGKSDQQLDGPVAGAVVMTIDQNGVGIRDNTPDYDLDVNGSINIAGNFSDNNHRLRLGNDENHIGLTQPSTIDSANTNVTLVRGRQVDLYAYDGIRLRTGTSYSDDIIFYPQGNKTVVMTGSEVNFLKPVTISDRIMVPGNNPVFTDDIASEPVLHILGRKTLETSDEEELIRLERWGNDINAGSSGHIGMWLMDNNLSRGEVARISFEHPLGDADTEGGGKLHFWTSNTPGSNQQTTPAKKMTLDESGKLTLYEEGIYAATGDIIAEQYPAQKIVYGVTSGDTPENRTLKCTLLTNTNTGTSRYYMFDVIGYQDIGAGTSQQHYRVYIHQRYVVQYAYIVRLTPQTSGAKIPEFYKFEDSVANGGNHAFYIYMPEDYSGVFIQDYDQNYGGSYVTTKGKWSNPGTNDGGATMPSSGLTRITPQVISTTPEF